METNDDRLANGTVELATPVRAKAVTRAIYWSIIAIGFLTVLIFAVMPEVTVTGEWWEIVLIAAGFFWMFIWGPMALAVHRFRAARTQHCYLRAGTEGLSVRSPGGLTWWVLLFQYDVVAIDIPWADFRGCTTLRVFPTFERFVVLQTAISERYAQAIHKSWEAYVFSELIEIPKKAIYLNGIHFAENVDEIAQRVNDLAAHYQPATQAQPDQGKENACPKCGFGFSWDGARCGHCGYSGTCF